MTLNCRLAHTDVDWPWAPYISLRSRWRPAISCVSADVTDVDAVVTFRLADLHLYRACL